MNNYSDTELQDIAYKAREEPCALSYTQIDVVNILKHLPKPVETEPTDAWEEIGGQDLINGDEYKVEWYAHTINGTYFERESYLFHHPNSGVRITKDNIDDFVAILYRKKKLPVEYGSVIKNVVLDSGEEVNTMVLCNIGWIWSGPSGVLKNIEDSVQIVSWERV